MLVASMAGEPSTVRSKTLSTDSLTGRVFVLFRLEMKGLMRPSQMGFLRCLALRVVPTFICAAPTEP